MGFITPCICGDAHDLPLVGGAWFISPKDAHRADPTKPTVVCAGVPMGQPWLRESDERMKKLEAIVADVGRARR